VVLVACGGEADGPDAIGPEPTAVTSSTDADPGAPSIPTTSTVDTDTVATGDVATTSPTASPPPLVTIPGIPTDEGRPLGFGTIGARVTEADGSICELCLWLAADGEARARGLMGVVDLGGAEGMAFRYDEPRTTAFTMRNTLLPLSIAFFDGEGRFLDAFDMEPCRAEPCPSYPTPTDFRVAVEVPAGGLPSLGMGPGSTLALLAEGCDPTAPRS
jgi:uncharacterized membrane protein (UPF0127 family)